MRKINIHKRTIIAISAAAALALAIGIGAGYCNIKGSGQDAYADAASLNASLKGSIANNDTDSTKTSENTASADSLSDQASGNGSVAASPSTGSAASEAAVQKKKRKKKVYRIAIDPGHQLHANFGTEPIGPGSSTKKTKVSGGTSGVVTHVPEYQLNLDVSKRLAKILRKRGYYVYMIRTKNDVDISNSQRAKAAKKKKCDILIRMHANGGASSAHGMMTLCMRKDNPYNSYLYSKSLKLSKYILDESVKATGARDCGISQVNNMTGINWASMPVTIFEMGFMTNPSEDRLMQKPYYQKKIAAGVANGVDRYFRRK
ncbi:MAG: N-acetylmuramoyl-L-alanine amidase [Lachnospiraceae bacterium]|jgi:N-acetylmuramoyl-L-alanine amidase|nr:N-acetylmuramoyl-L-alanine amidase [Lachnospiraceae bacterium]MEE3460275.1 N-acetylmuramoyl-L-alanine amidase [Lachnospiraceae bacterium]